MWFKRKLVMIPFDVSKRYNCTEGLIVKCIKSWTPIGESPKKVDKLSISKEWSSRFLDYYEAQHFYVVSDEEITHNDWVLLPNNEIHKMSPTDMIHYLASQSKATKKIIATTDSSLMSSTLIPVNNELHSLTISLPKPSQQFIEKYIEKYNKGNVISEVDVEYEVDYSIKCDETLSDCQRYSNKKVDCSNCIKAIFKLKVNSDNTINIKSDKDSWTLEELHDLLAKHEYDKGVIDWKNFIPELCNEIGYPIVEEWFETNE